MRKISPHRQDYAAQSQGDVDLRKCGFISDNVDSWNNEQIPL